MTEKDKGLYYTKGLPVPETPPAGEKPLPWDETDILGRRTPRVDAYERVSGTAVYPSDTVLPGMLYGAILRCPHPNARVKSINLDPARRMPGVRAVTGIGEPEAEIKWEYGGGVSSRLFDERCRFEGEAVAAAAADSPYQARDAIGAIEVEYEVLPFVADERDALDENAPGVHEGGNRVGEKTSYKRGDVARGFEEADFVLEREYRSECELHTPMELHGCTAEWDGGRLTIRESTQGVYAVQERVAKALDLPLSKVRVIGHYMGGGFGSKLQAGKYTLISAILARAAGRPVKTVLTREETYLAVGNRPPSNMKLKAGIKKNGTLTALEMSVLGTGGAYPAGGTMLVDWLVRDCYLCPNVKTEMTDVYINAGPARPFRAPGHPQGAWALEQMLDELADEAGICPVELRLKNTPAYSQARPGGPEYTTTGLEECLRRGAEEFGWDKAYRESGRVSPGVYRGAGMAGCLWVAGGGGPPSTVVIKLFSDGSVNLNMGASDIGTGTKTVMALTAAEEIGVTPDSIQIEHADTGTTQFATPSGGSKTVPTEAPAVRSAALEVKRQVLEMVAEEWGVEPEDLRYRGRVVETRAGDKSVKVVDVEKLQKRGVVIGVGYRGPNPADKVVNPFAAQFCEVEINAYTGELKILRFLGAHESGRVMDRLTYDNQVFGGITMGIGLASTEFRVLDRNGNGKLCNRNWHDYKLPTIKDVPLDMTSLPIDPGDDEANNTGAKGLGEPVTIPTAAAVANAVARALGRRVYDTGLNPVSLSPLIADRAEEV